MHKIPFRPKIGISQKTYFSEFPRDIILTPGAKQQEQQLMQLEKEVSKKDRSRGRRAMGSGLDSSLPKLGN